MVSRIKTYLTIALIGTISVFLFLMFSDPFFDRFDFKFRSPIELHWPVRLERRFPVEIIKYRLVTPTPMPIPTSTPFPKFELNNGIVE